MQNYKTYLTEEGWKKDLDETVKDFTKPLSISDYHKAIAAYCGIGAAGLILGESEMSIGVLASAGLVGLMKVCDTRLNRK